MSRKFVICRGIQGSGKSTWAKAWCAEDPEHRIRFNNDDIRNMLGNYWVPSRENLVTEAKANMLTFALLKGYDVVLDNMNLNPKEDEWIKTLCTNIEKDKGIHVDIEYKDFFIPVEECIRRDAMRPNPIGEKIIKQTWKRYAEFIVSEDNNNMIANRPKHIDGGHPVIIVDIDGTISLNTTGRPWYGEGAAEGMLTDMPIEGTCSLVRSAFDRCKVIIITGREGTPEVKKATETWLAQNNIKYDTIYYRPEGSFTAAPELKKNVYENNIRGKYNVTYVLEDNYKCVKMWRELGLTCLQPNEGKF